MASVLLDILEAYSLDGTRPNWGFGNGPLSTQPHFVRPFALSLLEVEVELLLRPSHAGI